MCQMGGFYFYQELACRCKLLHSAISVLMSYELPNASYWFQPNCHLLYREKIAVGGCKPNNFSWMPTEALLNRFRQFWRCTGTLTLSNEKTCRCWMGTSVTITDSNHVCIYQQ